MMHKIIIFILILFIIINFKQSPEYFTQRNIIIIGNAPFNKNIKNGKLIDRYNKVVRFNSFEVQGFNEYIGSRVDEWIVSDTHCLLLKKKFMEQNNLYPNVKINIIIPRVFKNNKFKLRKSLPEKILKKCNILIQDLDIVVDKKYNFGRKWPSTGILAIYYYLSKYEKIHITGFNHFDPKEKTIHYYEKRNQLGHQHNLEKKIVDDLVTGGRVVRI